MQKKKDLKMNQNINFSVLDNQLTTTAGTITTTTYTDQVASSAVDLLVLRK